MFERLWLPVGRHLFRRAIARRDAEKVRSLLERTPSLAKCEDWQNFHVWQGIRDADAEIIALILDHGASPNSEFAHRLMTHAAMYRLFEIARVLLAHGCEIDGDIFHRPLHEAAELCKDESVRFLLENGADPNAMDRGDRTPLDRVYEASRPEPDKQKTIDLLIQRGGRGRPRQAPKAPVPGGGSALCRSCEAAKEWWSRKTVAANFANASATGTGDQPGDFAGVCTRCRDGFCLTHAPDRVCPKCGSALKG